MLIDILNRIAEDYGDDTSEGSDDRLKLVARVNRAAKELHTAHDIREAIDEGVYNFNVDSQQVALPVHIGEPRHMRWHTTKEKIELDDMRNLYGYSIHAGDDPWGLKFRKLRVSPIERELNNESILTVSIPLANDEKFKVTISGKTTNAERRAETLTFAIGDLVHSTVGNYQEPMISISKNKVTRYDITVKDVDDNVVSIIPNNQNTASYNLYQIIDTDNGSLSDTQSGIEVLYKKAFEVVTMDYDNFWGVSQYDDSIFWKYSELYEAKDKDTVQLFYAKSLQTFMDSIRDEEAGQRRKMKLKRNKFLRISYARQRYHRL